MANTKISVLTSSTTPLAGTEVLPIVQSSATVKVSVANLTAGRSVSATSFVPSGSTIPANGLYLPATNAVGIATNSTNAIYVDASQNVGIGIATPTSPLHVAASTTLAAGQPSILLQGSSNTERIITRSTSAPVFATQFANGTLASPTAVTSGNFLGGYQFGGYAATAFNRGAQISGYADGTWTDTSTPAYIAFQTATAGSTTLTERLRVDSSGNTIVTNVAGLGYGTGSGGTVTQATSKSTAVTLNKPTGRITMNNAALLPATSVNFTLNNSVFGDADVCIVNPLSSDSYTVTVYQSYSGVINIRVTNYSAGSLSDALQIKFAIIKGSIS